MRTISIDKRTLTASLGTVYIDSTDLISEYVYSAVAPVTLSQAMVIDTSTPPLRAVEATIRFVAGKLNLGSYSLTVFGTGVSQAQLTAGITLSCLWDGSQWIVVKGTVATGAGDMIGAYNLAELTDIADARANLHVLEDTVITNALLGKSDVTHLHTGVYEPAFTTLSATKIPWGTGLNEVARGNHTHAGVYEPVFAKNTAFNKNFGSGATDVATGNHTHTSISISSTNSALNSALELAGNWTLTVYTGSTASFQEFYVHADATYLYVVLNLTTAVRILR